MRACGASCGAVYPTTALTGCSPFLCTRTSTGIACGAFAATGSSSRMAAGSVRSYIVLAVDPGESWCGLAEISLTPDSRGSLTCKLPDSGLVASSGDGRVRVKYAQCLRPDDLYTEIERVIPFVHHLILERYSLYPWMLAEQGYSEVLTAQCVGAVRYVCRKAGVPVTLQDAKQNLKEGRSLAKEHGFDMTIRVLGSGKWKYRGWDFNLPGRPHRRDALAHGVRWAYRDPQSPLVRHCHPDNPPGMVLP